MNEQFTILLGKPWLIPTSVGIAAFSGGIGLGYILGKRKKQGVLGELILITDDYVQTSTDETEDKPENEYVEFTPEEHAYLAKHPVVSEVEEATITVIAQPDDDWNYEAELSTRGPKEPYVIHRDEFFADEMGYTQSTVTYYSGDDILTDELDVPIYGHTAMVGELKFGHGSGDPNVVYIRSELLEHEYEVLQNFGRYEVEVLGHEIDEHYREDDLKHSAVPEKFKLE